MQRRPSQPVDLRATGDQGPGALGLALDRQVHQRGFVVVVGAVDVGAAISRQHAVHVPGTVTDGLHNCRLPFDTGIRIPALRQERAYIVRPVVRDDDGCVRGILGVRDARHGHGKKRGGAQREDITRTPDIFFFHFNPLCKKVKGIAEVFGGRPGAVRPTRKPPPLAGKPPARGADGETAANRRGNAAPSAISCEFWLIVLSC